MSQIEQDFNSLLGKKPEIEKCYQQGLINRRSLARFLINKGIAKPTQLEAIIAMLRRYNFKEQEKESKDLFKDIKIQIKDKISILDFEKNKELLHKLERLIATTDYDKGDTLKIVVGGSSITIFIDQERERKLNNLFQKYKASNKFNNISEMSLTFPSKAIKTKGILSTITRELALNEITITEFLTAGPELLIYVKEEHVMKVYEIIKRL